MRVDYHNPDATWVDEAKSKAAAVKFAALCGKCGVFAYPVRRPDGTWTVGMAA